MSQNRCAHCGQVMPIETVGQRVARERVVVVDQKANLIRIYGRPDVTVQARKELGLTAIQVVECLRQNIADMIDEAVREAINHWAKEKLEQTNEPD